MKRLPVVLMCCFPLLSFAQQWEREHVGIQLQLLATVGSHKTSVGIKLNTYVAFDYAQLNVGTAYRFHKANLGGRMNFGEWRHHTGLVVMAGKETNPVNFNWDGALHQSKRPCSIGYSYLWYVDKVGTTQRSGTWNFGIRRVDIQFENDVFAGQGKDRFRTGNFYVSYRDEQRSAGIGFMIWTGESAHAIWNRTPMRHSPSGYRDLTPLPYGKSSHGVLYFGGQQTFAARQVASLQVGVDSEQIRHVFQNRLIHDLIIFPKKMKRNTPHYPRLNAQGENVFSKQEKRPDVLYFQTAVNDLFLY
jgi:hypothetical protein